MRKEQEMMKQENTMMGRVRRAACALAAAVLDGVPLRG